MKPGRKSRPQTFLLSTFGLEQCNTTIYIVEIDKKRVADLILTRMHSSRMRTARTVTIRGWVGVCVGGGV